VIASVFPFRSAKLVLRFRVYYTATLDFYTASQFFNTPPVRTENLLLTTVFIDAGFTELLKIRAAEAKTPFPTR
jgi:hypothetical protein